MYSSAEHWLFARIAFQLVSDRRAFHIDWLSRHWSTSTRHQLGQGRPASLHQSERRYPGRVTGSAAGGQQCWPFWRRQIYMPREESRRFRRKKLPTSCLGWVSQLPQPHDGTEMGNFIGHCCSDTFHIFLKVVWRHVSKVCWGLRRWLYNKFTAGSDDECQSQSNVQQRSNSAAHLTLTVANCRVVVLCHRVYTL